jgi:Amt family ammonium transporter
LLAGVFASPALGIFSGYGFANGIQTMGAQLSVQLIGIIAVFLYTAILTWLILQVVEKLVGLRVSHEDEVQGLDITQHEERGYDYL